MIIADLIAKLSEFEPDASIMIIFKLDQNWETFFFDPDAGKIETVENSDGSIHVVMELEER